MRRPKAETREGPNSTISPTSSCAVSNTKLRPQLFIIILQKKRRRKKFTMTRMNRSIKKKQRRKRKLWILRLGREKTESDTTKRYLS